MSASPPVPAYLAQTYQWAYLDQRTLPWLDRSLVVSAILWGNAARLMRNAVAEFEPGQHVMQAACVYGDFSSLLAARVGAQGALDLVDVAEIQLANARRKLQGRSQVHTRQADLAAPGSVPAEVYDGVCCFFLLHEVPEAERCRIVDHLLAGVKPGGKIVFVDYHAPHAWHPLRPVMHLVWRWFEPFAISLFDSSIPARSALADQFEWTTTTSFAGLYQQVVGRRKRLV